MIAIFARANHPYGYGFGSGPDNRGGAHGYIVIGVRCRSQKEVDRVIKHIQDEGLDLPDEGRNIYPHGVPERRYDRKVNMYYNLPSNTDTPVIRWYSGGPYDWDYLFTVHGNKVDNPGSRETTGAQFDSKSRGDNRFTWVYDADEVLAEHS